MTPPRVVLDTNVLLSALLFHARPLRWLRNAWQSDVVRPLASRDTTAELIRVLHCAYWLRRFAKPLSRWATGPHSSAGNVTSKGDRRRLTESRCVPVYARRQPLC